MRTGVHCAIAGGLLRATEEAEKKKCETIQIFSRSPRGWGAREFSEQEVQDFQKERRRIGIEPLVVHMLYLPNLATSNPELYEKSVSVLMDEMRRCERIGAEYLVVHPGRHSGTTREIGVAQVKKALNTALSGVDNGVMILLENLAGGGTDIGADFGELAEILDCVDAARKKRIAVCLDTCHAHAAGHDMSEKKSVQRVLEEFNRAIGLEKIKVLHFNDCKGPFFCRVDRHQHIGQGSIGLEGFRAVINEPALKDCAGILETPKDSETADKKNLKTLRDLIAG